jgi:predicted transposase YdaD
VDKLVKVFLKNGEERWILIHIEVQGYRDPDFEKRMFIYYYRIFDKYQREITAWAIYRDGSARYHPNEFSTEFLGTKLVYNFNTYKVLAQNEEILKKSDNPFAIVILTVLLALKKDNIEGEELVELKLDIVKNLLKKGFSKEKVRSILNFIHYYVRLEKKDNEIFEVKLNQLTGKTFPMGIEQYLLERERKEGFEQGIEKGIEQGIEKGEFKKTTEMILRMYEHAFDVETIASCTNVSTDFVLDLLRENGRI